MAQAELGNTLESIVAAYQDALSKLAAAACRSVAAACLGCGYGRCPTSEFISALRELVACDFPSIDMVTVVTTNRELFEAILAAGLARAGEPGD